MSLLAKRKRFVAMLAVTAVVGMMGCRGKITGSSAASASSSAESATWTRYASPNGLYDAKFFGPPNVEKAEEAQTGGAMLATTSVTATDEARLFMINELELSKIVQYDCKTGLEGMVRKSLERMGCASEDDQPTTLGGKPGRDVRFACDKRPARGRMRVFCDVHAVATGHVTAYSVMAIYQNELWDPVEAAAFLDSFVLH